ncbi:MAG: hypothetical protein AB7G80_08920 [Dongiaceae bacterium]
MDRKEAISEQQLIEELKNPDFLEQAAKPLAQFFARAGKFCEEKLSTPYSSWDARFRIRGGALSFIVKQVMIGFNKMQPRQIVKFLTDFIEIAEPHGETSLLAEECIKSVKKRFASAYTIYGPCMQEQVTKPPYHYKGRSGLSRLCILAEALVESGLCNFPPDKRQEYTDRLASLWDDFQGKHHPAFIRARQAALSRH